MTSIPKKIEPGAETPSPDRSVPNDLSIGSRFIDVGDHGLTEDGNQCSITHVAIQAMMFLADARRSHISGECKSAEAAYRTALRLQPNLTTAALHLGELLLNQRRSAEAIAVAQQLTEADPSNAEAYYLIGSANANLGNGAPALAALQRAVEINPALGAAHLKIGVLLGKLGRWQEALAPIERAISLRPGDASGYIELGAALARLGNELRAQSAFEKAAQLQPLTIVPPSGTVPGFSALVIWAPGRANTPIGYLMGHAPYERRMLAVIEGREPETHPLHASSDVIVNLVADADQAAKLLPSIGAFIDRIDRPVINHPRAILTSDRQSTAACLSNLPHCRVPRVVRCSRFELGRAVARGELFEIAFPVLIRVAGTHGGDAFECANSPQDICAFAAENSSDDYYLTEFVDYRSADGYFRKYRLIHVDGRLFPYHLAIDGHWKIHHHRTKMGETDWMQQEELNFLVYPENVFTPEHYAAFRQIAERMSLDFFGIDCALTRDGQLLVFEVNACMLIEPDDSGFTYKIPFNSAIRDAFTAMLARKAGTNVRGAPHEAVPTGDRRHE